MPGIFPPSSSTRTTKWMVELVFREAVEELGNSGATFVHKMKNRRNAGTAFKKSSRD